MLTPVYDTSLTNLKDQLDAALESLIGQQNTEDRGMLTAGALAQSADDYEWQDWEGNREWEGNESYLGSWKKQNTTFHFHASDEVQTEVVLIS